MGIPWWTMVRIQCSHCQGPEFNPCSGNKDATSLVVRLRGEKKILQSLLYFVQVHPPAHQLGPCDCSPQSTGAHVSTPNPQKLHTLWDKENENSREVVFITFLVYKQALVCKNGTVLSYFHTPFSVRPKATQEAPPDPQDTEGHVKLVRVLRKVHVAHFPSEALVTAT